MDCEHFFCEKFNTMQIMAAQLKKCSLLQKNKSYQNSKPFIVISQLL